MPPAQRSSRPAPLVKNAGRAYDPAIRRDDSLRNAIAFALLALPGTAAAQIVGIYADSLAGSCNLTIPYPGPPVNAYVVFTPGPLAPAMSGAEFSIRGLPEGWTAQAFPNPSASTAWGSPFDWSGARIDFPSCQGTVVLYRLRLTPSSSVADHELQIAERIDPWYHACPWILGCEDQLGTALTETRALVNGMTTCDPDLSRGCPWTSVEDLEAISTSMRFAANPAGAQIAIHYRLAPGTSRAHLAIYDLRGRVLARLPLTAEAPARGTIDWDRRDARGAAVAAGVYVVRLESGAPTIARKLVLVD